MENLKVGDKLTLIADVYYGSQMLGIKDQKVTIKKYNIWPNGNFKSVELEEFFGLYDKDAFVELNEEGNERD